jgi:hypothetical protein
MGRRTKEELLSSNYYEWLEDCNKLRAQKKDGIKPTPSEKLLLKTLPTPEAPYSRAGKQPEEVKPKKKSAKAVKIDFTRDVVWPVKGGSFLCAVFNTPYTDEQCLVLCERDDCPFHGQGYFRSHGFKF